MIKLMDLCAVLDSIGIPWSNQSFTGNDEPAPPYIVLVAGYGESVYADNRVYASWTSYDIALYTRRRDYALERKIKDALDAADCSYTLAVTSIESEKLVETAFSVDVEE